jgi:hypothetical protein
MDVHGAAVGVVHAVDAELLVELGMECWVASVEGADQPAGLFQEASNLLGREPLRGCVRVSELDFGGGPGSGDLGDPLLHDGRVSAGLESGPVAVQAALAVGQHLLGGPPLVAGWVAAAGGGEGLAGVVEVGWAEHLGQPVVETAD